MPRTRRPGQQRGIDVDRLATAVIGDDQFVALIKADGPFRPIELDEGLGKRFDGEPGCVTAIDDRLEAVLMVQQDGRHVLPLYSRIDPHRASRKPTNLPEQKSRNVENMNSEIFDNETLAFGEVGLTAEYVKTRPKRDPAPEGLSDRA